MTQIAVELLVEIIKLNKENAREPSKHLQALEQLSTIFKDTTDVSIPRVNTTNAPIAPTSSHSPIYRETVKMTQQSHQHCPHINTPIIHTRPSTTPITPLD